VFTIIFKSGVKMADGKVFGITFLKGINTFWLHQVSGLMAHILPQNGEGESVAYQGRKKSKTTNNQGSR